MSRLKSRLDKLDGANRALLGKRPEYISTAQRPEWPDDVEDFICVDHGVYFREPNEDISTFVRRVQLSSYPHRDIVEMTDAELEASAASWLGLIQRMKPEFRRQYQATERLILEALGQEA